MVVSHDPTVSGRRRREAPERRKTGPYRSYPAFPTAYGRDLLANDRRPGHRDENPHRYCFLRNR